MDMYLEQALHKVHHKSQSSHRMHQPKQYQYNMEQKYGKQKQIPHHGYQQKESKQLIQKIVGIFKWYSRAVDPTMVRTLSSISARQAKATTKVKEEVKQFFDYCARHPNATVRFLASDMILALHLDASYLSETESKSRAA